MHCMRVSYSGMAEGGYLRAALLLISSATLRGVPGSLLIVCCCLRTRRVSLPCFLPVATCSVAHTYGGLADFGDEDSLPECTPLESLAATRGQFCCGRRPPTWLLVTTPLTSLRRSILLTWKALPDTKGKCQVCFLTSLSTAGRRSRTHRSLTLIRQSQHAMIWISLCRVLTHTEGKIKDTEMCVCIIIIDRFFSHCRLGCLWQAGGKQTCTD